MPKRSWNDIDDSDSSLSSLSDQENVPTIEKQFSAPPLATSKLKNACDEMSLKKLEKHEGSDVWLYIPNSFYEMADEVDYTLERRQQLKKITRINIGWNVLTQWEYGRTLIEQGIAEERFFIKFIYSSKNEERGSNDDRQGKLQKKVTYVEKNAKPQTVQKEQTLEEAKVEQKNSANEGDRKNDKKKKWVEKSKSMNADEVKSNITSHEEPRSPRKYEGAEGNKEEWKAGNNWPSTIKSPNKYAKKEVRSPRKFKEKETVQAMEPTKIEPETKEDNEPKPKKSQAYGSDSELSQQKQQRKKKKKKTQKKSKQPSKASKGDQNPFSYFME